MGRRWIGLGRAPAPEGQRRTTFKRACREGARALGVAGVLLLSAALNFTVYPDALAAVVTGERELRGFVAEEPSAAPAPPPILVDDEEVRLLAATAWAEARSEGEDGMRAVAHVIVNRMGARFGADLKSVVLAPWQFSAWNEGDPNRPLAETPERYATGGANLETWLTAQRVAREVLAGQSTDPTEGALFYHTRAIRPWWSRYGEGRIEIGAHVFYRDVPDQTRPRVVAVTRAMEGGELIEPSSVSAEPGEALTPPAP